MGAANPGVTVTSRGEEVGRKHKGPKMQLPCPPPQLKRWVPGPCQRPRGRWRPAPVLGGSPPRPRRRLHLRRACLSLSGADSNNPPQSHCPQCIPARSLARGPRCAYPSTGMRVPKHTPCEKKHPHPPPPSCPKCQNVRIACITRHPVAHAIPRLFKHFRFRKAWPHPRHLATRLPPRTGAGRQRPRGLWHGPGTHRFNCGGGQGSCILGPLCLRFLGARCQCTNWGVRGGGQAGPQGG